MWFGLDLQELGLIGIILGVFVLRAMVPSMTRRIFPKRSALREPRAWTWLDKIAVAFAVAVLGGVWFSRPGSLAPVVGGIGIALVVKAISGLLALRTKTRADDTSRPTTE
jgi:hypothetical protein